MAMRCSCAPRVSFEIPQISGRVMTAAPPNGATRINGLLTVPLLHDGHAAGHVKGPWPSAWVIITVTLAVVLCCAVCAILYAIFWSPMLVPLPHSSATAVPKMRGVNIGGWLILEPWVTPSMLYPFLCVGPCPTDKPPVIDERSFCARLGHTEAQRRLDEFRSAWVTEATFARIASAGLNTVRLPFGYWIFGDTDLCPAVTSIHHLDNAVTWAERYGLNVVLDLHGVQPTQNGMDHSGTSSHQPFAHDPGWHRPPFSGREWLQADNVAVTRRILQRIGKRYAMRRHVVRIGMVNEPMLMSRDWCDRDCPIQIEELVEYYTSTWSALASVVSSTQQPVLDAGLGGSIAQWGTVTLPSNLRDAIMCASPATPGVTMSPFLQTVSHSRVPPSLRQRSPPLSGTSDPVLSRLTIPCCPRLNHDSFLGAGVDSLWHADSASPSFATICL